MVTGGCGFIGSHVVRRLLSEGVGEVVVVDSLRYGRIENLDPQDARVTIVQHTLGRDPIAALRPGLERCDYLMHLAAEKHNQSKGTPRDLMDTNVSGSFELFQLAGQCGVKGTLFASSLYAYGRTRGDAMREDMLPEPQTLYGISKLSGEHLLRFLAEETVMRYACVRLFFVYGPRQFSGLGYKSVIVKNFERIARGDPPVILGDGQQVLDYVYVDDTVEMLLRALLTEGLPPVLNIGSGIGVSIRELTASMLEVAGSNLVPVHGPPDWTQGTQRVADVSIARNLLKWTPQVPLRAGLERAYAWILEAIS